LNCERTDCQRSSWGDQLFSCQSEGIQISTLPGRLSAIQSSACWSIEGISDLVWVGETEGCSSRFSIEMRDWAERLALSIRTNWLVSEKGAAASVIISMAFCLRDVDPSEVSMLPERSRSNRMASGEVLTAQPSHPPVRGRPRNRTSASTARVRSSRMRNCFSLAWLVELLLAARRNCMAAQGWGRWRSRLIRWMITGSRIRGRPQRMSGCRNVIALPGRVR